MKKFATGLVWGEGPRYSDGALWVSDTQGSRLWTDATGTWSPYELASPSNGLWFLPDGSLVGVMMAQARVGRWTGAEFTTYADLGDLARGNLGDVVGDALGNLYVDDLGPVDFSDLESARSGQLLFVGADGTTHVAADEMAFPNGLALVDDGRTLVVAETFAQRLIAFDVAPDGSLSGRRVVADLAVLVGKDARPDGIWGVPDGIWVATLDAQVVVKIRDGEVVATVPTAGPPIACCADDSGRLFVTVADSGGRPVFEALRDKTVRVEVWVGEA